MIFHGPSSLAELSRPLARVIVLGVDIRISDMPKRHPLQLPGPSLAVER